MDYPPFICEYPLGAGLMAGCIGSILYSITTGSPADFMGSAFLLGAWVGYHLRWAEREAVEEDGDE
jgi:hypothetical protein